MVFAQVFRKRIGIGDLSGDDDPASASSVLPESTTASKERESEMAVWDVVSRMLTVEGAVLSLEETYAFPA